MCVCHLHSLTFFPTSSWLIAPKLNLFLSHTHTHARTQIYYHHLVWSEISICIYLKFTTSTVHIYTRYHVTHAQGDLVLVLFSLTFSCLDWMDDYARGRHKVKPEVKTLELLLYNPPPPPRWYMLCFYQTTKWWSTKPAPSHYQRSKHNDLEMKKANVR